MLWRNILARKKPTPKESFVMFNVAYEDGTVTSNRRVPESVLDGLEGDAPAQAVIEEQDRMIEEQSGRSRGPIKSIMRSPVR
jgi:hypothetical protein